MSNREIALLFLLLGAGALYWYSTTPSGTAFVNSTADAIGGAFVNRGIRNCNPGNIRRSSNAWVGKFATQADCEAAGRVWDTAFEVFDTMEHGVRAMGHLLNTYAQSYGFNTVNQVVYRYAPPSDGNNTATYAANVANYLGVAPDTQIDIYSILPNITLAMCQEETGYSEDVNTVTTWVYEA